MLKNEYKGIGIHVCVCFLSPQESYNLLQKHGIQVSQEDIERVDTLRYMWQKLHEQVAAIQTVLLKIQPQFKEDLLDKVEAYQKEVSTFADDYTTVS